VERLTGLSGGVDITNLLALHEPVLVVKRGLNHTVPNSLGHNVLGRLFAVKSEAKTDIAQRDTGVRQRHHTNTGLDDILSEAQNQGVCAILSESLTVGVDNVEESIKVTCTDCLRKQQVRVHGLFQSRLAEDSTVWNITHQQLNDYQQLVRSLVKSASNGAGRRLAGSANQMAVSLRILQLDGTDAAKVIQIPSNLVVGSSDGEWVVGDQKICL
jgi:hypothetical protein